MVDRIQYHLPDWNTGTDELSFEEEAVYRKLCDWFYLTDGHLKDDDFLNSRRCKVSSRLFRARKIALINAGKLDVENGFLTNFRLRKELEKTLELSANSRRKAAKRWAKAQKKNNIDDAAASAQHMLTVNRKPVRESNDSLYRSFEQWWHTYPRKIGKGQARNAFKGALKKATLETLLASTKKFAASVSDKEPQFIPHPSTWLNGERWLDEPVNGTAHPATEGTELQVRRWIVARLGSRAGFSVPDEVKRAPIAELVKYFESMEGRRLNTFDEWRSLKI